MRPPADLPVHSDTLVAIVLGAVLATVSGMLATSWEARARRRERAKSAAMFYGGLLSTIGILLDFAVAARERGDPYGPITLRMLRQLRREFDLYDRNREGLYDLAETPLRAQIHSLMVRMAMPLDGILDATDRLALASKSASTEAARLRLARDAGFDFLAQLRGEIPGLLAVLSRAAGQSLEAYRPPPPPAGPAPSL